MTHYLFSIRSGSSPASTTFLVLITGMTPKASFGNVSQQAAGYYTLRFAGLFDLQISTCDLQVIHFVFEI
jgi:hypothetical protein